VYAQLDRIDLTVSTRDGEPQRFVQCDHRDAAEIAARETLSSVLAVLKIAVARASNDGVPVEYVCEHAPPGFLVSAIVAAGGVLRVSEQPASALLPPPPVDDEYVDRAFAALAAETSARDRDEPTLEGLHALERRVTGTVTADTRSRDELAFWTAVVELAAATGELLRPLAPRGGWRYAADVHPPFVFTLELPDGAVMRVNPLGKATRFIEDGPHEAASSLVAAARAYLTR